MIMNQAILKSAHSSDLKECTYLLLKTLCIDFSVTCSPVHPAARAEITIQPKNICKGLKKENTQKCIVKC